MKDRPSPPLSQIFSAALLIAGTCIGAGMLALADVTGIAGFFPSLIAMLTVFLAMTLSGLLLAEASLWMPEGAHYLTIAEKLTGKVGKVLSWFLFLFISYASLIAYTAEGGSVVHDFCEALFGWGPGKIGGAITFLLAFGFLVDFGTAFVGRINAILFIAMITAYTLIILGGIPSIQLSRLGHREWPTIWYLFPFLLTSFSFHTVVPSMTPFLNKNRKALICALTIGTLVTLLVYLLWLWVVLGAIPVEGGEGLQQAFLQGDRATKFFFAHVPRWVAVSAEFFAFFAMVTSFLGMGLGLFDFLADGLKVEKKGKGKALLAFFIIVPTLFVATQFERIFLLAIDASGGYGDTLLSGILPALFVWRGRYVFGYPAKLSFLGKGAIVFVFAFFAFCLALEIMIHSGWICTLVAYCQQRLVA